MKVKITFSTQELVFDNLSELRKAVTTRQFFIGIKQVDVPELPKSDIQLQILDDDDNIIEDKTIINVTQSIDYLAGITHLLLQYE